MNSASTGRLTDPPPDNLELGRLREILVRYVSSRIAARQDVDDVVQDVLLAATAVPRPAHVDVVPWVLGIARNKSADWWRVRQSDRQVLCADPPEDEDAASGPEDQLMARERAAYARRCLAQLDARDADLLRLRMAGASASELGAALGLSEVAVRVAQHRALSRLRTIVSGGCEHV